MYGLSHIVVFRMYFSFSVNICYLRGKAIYLYRAYIGCMPYYEVELDDGQKAFVRANNIKYVLDSLFYEEVPVISIESIKRVKYNLVIV